MYVTRPLSLYKTNPEALSLPPSEGPNSGYLVLQDEGSTPTHFFGLLKDNTIKDFPFPQNKLHAVTHTSVHTNGSQRTHRTAHYDIYFIPAINHPLSSNINYAIKTKGKHKGQACTSSTDDEMATCCLFNCINDVKPRPLDPANTYQQFKVTKCKSWHHSGFMATSVAHDGHPPEFLRRKGWHLESKTPKRFSLEEAHGLDLVLRARLPDFNFPPSYSASNSIVVGKWYCPFMFIKELTPKDQVKKSMFYQMTLEQQWERIFLCENENKGSSQDNKTVFVDVTVPTESIKVAETEAFQDNSTVNPVVWFNSLDGRTRVGLSSLILTRMMWEEERGGWIPKVEKQEKVLKIEEFGGHDTWTRHGCYMLVERFVLRRMDGSVVLTYSFNHTHQIRSKWE